MENKEKRIEQVLEEALRSYDRGATLASIVAANPDFKVEIEEFLLPISLLGSTKENISPRREGLSKLLGTLPLGESAGRTQEGKNFLSFLPWRIYAPILAAILLIIGGITFRYSTVTKAPMADNVTTGIASGDTSDAAIDQTVNDIDSQMAGLSSDESNADQALSQSYQ